MDTLRDATEIFPAYEQLLDARNIPAKAKPYYLRWAKAWTTTAESDNPSAAQIFFQCLGRRANLPAWQFQQAVRAVAWLARDILKIHWAASTQKQALNAMVFLARKVFGQTDSRPHAAQTTHRADPRRSPRRSRASGKPLETPRRRRTQPLDMT